MPSYPVDEFDNDASQRGPVGVHRKHKSVVMAIVAPFLVFIAAGALAYGVVVHMWGQGGGPRDNAAPTVAHSEVADPAEDLATASPLPIETPSPTPTQTAEPLHFEASVAVLNGAKIKGLAGTNADKVKAGGFTTVTASNVSADLPPVNTVRYADPIYETTARQVAALLGITAVERGVTPEGNIAVILVTDPAK